MIIYQYLSYQNLNVESDISLSRFFLLLDKLDVSIEEFYGILSQDNPTHTEKLLEVLVRLIIKTIVYRYRSTLEKERRKFELTQDKSFLYNSIMLESFWQVFQIKRLMKIR